MLLLLLFTLLVLSLSHWLFVPLLRGLTPALSSVALGWVLLSLVVWLLAGASSDEPPRDPKA
jgi:hypothetical protein